ncbi:MAG: cytochrome C oxidase subunit IV family protein [Arcobacter sp.]|uniref:cytochrome C oxidase subunit IV family protein n=1 Tax=Arcobacter sp. TaxID=1872629 RepID=UPI003B0026E1
MRDVVSHEMTAQKYIKVFIVLVVLTALTFLQPFILPSNVSNTVLLQLLISCLKTVLIVSYYMHLKYETTLFRYIVLFAVVTLGIFFVITATDAIFRNETFDMFQVGD